MNVRRLFAILAPVVLTAACAQSDAGITTSVKSKLVADDTVKAREINVDTKDRVVTLTGVVESPEEEAKALQIARNTEGVANVVDNISIAAPGEPGAAPTTGRMNDLTSTAASAATDAGITTTVKAKLLADPTVGGLAIDVDTRNGVVSLSGTVAGEAEKARAAEVASKVENVIRVDDRLVIKTRVP